MSRAETNILSCRVRYLVFRIRKGWTGLERQHRRGQWLWTGWGSCCSKGLASRRGRPLSLGELLTAICGLVFDLGAKIVDVYVRRVRRQRASIR